MHTYESCCGSMSVIMLGCRTKSRASSRSGMVTFGNGHVKDSRKTKAINTSNVFSNFDSGQFVSSLLP